MSAMSASGRGRAIPTELTGPTGLTPERLRALRVGLGLTQAELARRLHFSRAAVGRWERAGGGGVPRVHWRPALEALATARAELRALYAEAADALAGD